MKYTLKFIQVFLYVTAPFATVALSTENDATTSFIRSGNNEIELDSHGRQLSMTGSWSWANLLCKLYFFWSAPRLINNRSTHLSNILCLFFLFCTDHLHVCHVHPDCPGKPHPGPCGCPDCSKPHPPHFQNSYCENISSLSAEEEVEGDGEDAERTNGENGTNGTGQTGSSRFNGWIIFLAAAVACSAIGAAAMRKRVSCFLQSCEVCVFHLFLTNWCFSIECRRRSWSKRNNRWIGRKWRL